MCGRFNIIDDPLCKLTSELFGIHFTTISNDNVCPSQTVATVAYLNNQFCQLNTSWGIQPSWAKRLLINAQAETVSVKPTFKRAFRTSRCVIPLSAWYEWKTNDAGKKDKYLFSGNTPDLYMAGIYYEGAQSSAEPQSGLFATESQQPNYQLVSLTTQPNPVCAEIHSRMPLLLSRQTALDWLQKPADELGDVLNFNDFSITIKAC